ncbi:MAG: histidine phosphatase family protein [Taibaiella sp.]|jgi:phosphohistidine phosphatase
MERTLILIRHAKSDWGSMSLKDYDRPLNQRGKKDAHEMGRRLREKHNIIPDLIISSPAVRAASTAKLIAAEVGYDPEQIRWVEKLYHCPAEVFEEIITAGDIADDIKTVFIVAHNPGISLFAHYAIPALILEDMPTCGIVGLTFNATHWSDYANTKHVPLFFDYPKNQ